MPGATRHLPLEGLKDRLSAMYHQEGMSLGDIARQFGVSRTAIHKRMLQFGIRARSRSESRLLALRQGKFPTMLAHSVNEKFFRSWTKEMAYVLGLMLTDGCVSKDLQTVTLAMNDREILDKVRTAMRADIPVLPSKHQAKLHIFRITRSSIAKDLIRIGVTPRKSLTVAFPPVPDEYLSHFIRGVFDGDGSVTLIRYAHAKHPTHATWLRTVFNSGSEKFIVELERKLQSLGMPPQNIYKQQGGKNPYYKFGYGGNNSKKLLAIMYRDTENRLYLERKFRVFQLGMTHESKAERFKLSDAAPEALRRYFAHPHANRRHMGVARLAQYIGCSRGTLYRWAKTDAAKIKKRHLERIGAFMREYMPQNR